MIWTRNDLFNALQAEGFAAHRIRLVRESATIFTLTDRETGLFTGPLLSAVRVSAAFDGMAEVFSAYAVPGGYGYNVRFVLHGVAPGTLGQCDRCGGLMANDSDQAECAACIAEYHR